MSDPNDSIDLVIKSRFDGAGAKEAQDALRGLGGAAVRAAPSLDGLAGNAKTAAKAVEGLSKEEVKAAQTAQRLAQAEERTAKTAADAATAEQRHQREIANTAKAQDQAATAALRRAQAEAKASSSSGSGGGAAGFASRVGSGVVGEIGSAVSATAIAGGIVAGGAALVAATAQAATFGAQVDKVTTSFEQLAQQSGTTGDALLGALRTGAAGEIDDLNLKLAANRANLLGVAKSADEFSKLFQIARARSQALGTTTTDAFNDLVTGLGRGSPLILDNLGIMVKLGEANDAYAASLGKTAAALTEAEKKQALINAVLATAGDLPAPPVDEYAALGAAFDNAKQHVSSFIAEVLRVPAKVTTDVIVNVTQASERDGGKAAVASLDTKAMQQAITAIQQAATGLNPAFELPTEKAKQLTDQLTRLADSGTPAIQATTAALARQFLTSGDAQEGIDMLTTALAQLESAQSDENEAALEAQRIGEQTVGVRTAIVDAVAEEVAQKLAEADATAQAADVQAAMNDVLALAMVRHEDAAGAAGVLASTFGISEGAALAAARAYYAAQDAAAAFAMVSVGLSTFNGAAGLANQRSGERGGSGSAGVDRAVAQAQTARNRALEIPIAAREKRDKAAGRAGESAAKKAEREAKALDTAQERAQSVLDKQADYEEELARKREKAAQDRDDKLAEIAKDEGARLAEIQKDAADKLSELDTSTAKKRADLETQTSGKLKSIRSKLASDLKAIDARAAADQENARRGLGESIAASVASGAVSNAADNLDLAGNGGDPALARREAMQAQRQAALQAAGQRAQGFGDATVGAASFAAEQQMIQQRTQLDETYAQKQEELAGNPQALAELENYYALAIAAQNAYVAEQVQAAEQEAAVKAAQIEQEKEAARAAAEAERKAVLAEKAQQTKEIAAEAEAQRAKIEQEAQAARDAAVAKAAEARDEVGKAFADQSKEIDTWATDAETDIQRVIDKLDGLEKKAYDAAKAMKSVPSGGGAAASSSEGGAAVPGRAMGGDVSAGSLYRVNEKGAGREEYFVPDQSGTIYPLASDIPYFSPASAAGSRTSTINLGGITVIAQPGQDANAIANLAADRAMAKLTQAMNRRMW